MLALAGEPYVFLDVSGFDRRGPARDDVLTVNPLAQVPTLVLDDGGVLTETAAIALWLRTRAPGLAPPAGSPEDAGFLRLLVWLVANVYPTFTYGDYPERWTPSTPQELVLATDRHREGLYLWFEKQVVGPFALGPEVSAIDCYLAVMTSWRPREAWFLDKAPRLSEAARRTRALPRLKGVMAANGLS